ncbi:MAG: hypothetical protein CMD07_04185 [Flavobacteriales bacterium]|jgi:hypothetical protein|nr:hypothetical protein [Flavobacteriales bacterium]|tara:strand:- start:4886 stop:5584 length:699 start_codon:yes stop_codon:yes gene_type:complete
MKKILLSILFVLVTTLTTTAQTRKGTILLGAGSQLSETGWLNLQITPKVGYFVQDGIAIGALINFASDNVDKPTYELNSNLAEIGVFGRYYVSNNLFTEISLSSRSNSVEEYSPVMGIYQQHVNSAGDIVAPNTPGAIASFDASGNPQMIMYSDGNNPDYFQVVENSEQTLNFNLGLGYTIVWREHFAVEPFMNLTFRNGELKEYNQEALIVESSDVKGTHFNLGVNFSLFF